MQLVSYSRFLPFSTPSSFICFLFVISNFAKLITTFITISDSFSFGGHRSTSSIACPYILIWLYVFFICLACECLATCFGSIIHRFSSYLLLTKKILFCFLQLILIFSTSFIGIPIAILSTIFV